MLQKNKRALEKVNEDDKVEETSKTQERKGLSLRKIESLTKLLLCYELFSMLII